MRIRWSFRGADVSAFLPEAFDEAEALIDRAGDRA